MTRREKPWDGTWGAYSARPAVGEVLNGPAHEEAAGAVLARANKGPAPHPEPALWLAAQLARGYFCSVTFRRAK